MKKNNKGRAYIFVLIASLAIIGTVGILLHVSNTSRATTARYIPGLYDLAVGAKEIVLGVLSQNIHAHTTLADKHQQAILDLNTHIPGLNAQWQLYINYMAQSELARQDEYTISVNVTILADSFLISTTVVKTVENQELSSLRPPVVATARAIWRQNALDYYTLEVVEFIRVAN